MRTRNDSRRLTADDVARAAGVSRATVSYALNDNENQRISPETRERVRRVARELGYTPNAAALNLRAGSNSLVLYSVPYWPLGSRVADGVAMAVEALERHGFQALVLFRSAIASDAFLAACAQVQPVGILAPASLLDPQTLRVLAAGGTKAVIAIGERPVPSLTSVVIPQAPFGRLAAEHLAGRGHRHVLFASPDLADTAPLASSRISAIRSVLRGTGTVEPLAHPDDVAATARLLAGCLERPNRPTAVVALSDANAVTILRAARTLGLSVPNDLAIVGADDADVAIAADPPLTSVWFDRRHIMERAAGALAALVNGRDAPRTLRIGDFHLTVRGST